ncbi:MAG: flavodoxin-dependent (E)-4-hydroxy-3-methylbut-2-enyl-diphosphate synthase [Clostridia bacterium]|nr:flavodoxin-dependent (E)-4-hydroxy-3-methylbut-2-enyl-diphosphate synthase [Clostridia bacterium]
MPRLSNPVTVRGLKIGGGAPVVVQSMTNTKTADVQQTLSQIKHLEEVGCKLVRVTVPDTEAAEALPAIRRGTELPLCADIHFDYRLALEAVRAGFDKIRINPGNIGSKERVRLVAAACAERGIPIRIGVNSGSVEKELLQRYGGPTPEALVESALRHAALLEEVSFTDIVISIKASNVRATVEANRLLARCCPYAIHLGVTEAGTPTMGVVKSAVGIGSLLLDGIGDTIRVSLTADPVEEIPAAYRILSACGLLPDAPELISCPTCGRTGIDLIPLANRVEEALAKKKVPIKVAVMGCVVNGPGEAREADVGIAGGRGEGVLFSKGKILKKVPESMLFEELMQEIDRMERERCRK